MRVLMLTQWFDPEPTFKGLLFAKGLREKGCHVEVITGFPNYPGGKIYPGHRLHLYKKEILEGIIVHRVWLYPSHDGSARKRVLNYLSFCLSAIIRGLTLKQKFDVMYVYHPPATVGLAGATIGLLRRIPFVYDIQDLWPDTLKATGMIHNGALLKLIGKVCFWIYHQASKIVVLSPGFEKALRDRGINPQKIRTIYNWADEKALRASHDRDFPALKGKFNILFAGNMGKAQALETVLEAAQQVLQVNSNVQFVFVGGGISVSDLKKRAESMSLPNVLFFPQMPMNEVGSLISKCQVLLVHLRKDPLFEVTVPSKTQAYMALGKPILMAVEGDAADLIRRARGGLCIPSENMKAISDAALILAQMPSSELEALGQNAKKFYEENLSFHLGVSKFIDVLESAWIK